LRDWLCRGHGHAGSLKSVLRYCRRTFPAPADHVAVGASAPRARSALRMTARSIAS
jgi:hypothetical protein